MDVEDINIDCPNKLKEEYCQRLLDAINAGDNKLAIFLIDDLIKKNIDVRCDDSIPFGFAIRDTVCSTLWLACHLGRFIIVEHLIKTGEFEDCILETVRLLINNEGGIMYDYKEDLKQYKKEKHNKLLKMLKLMLSYVKPNRIQELKAISENHQEYYTLSDDETFEEKMENNIGNDWRSEYYTESDLAYYKAIFEEETAKFLRENSEINYIIIERIRELELMEPDKPKLIFAGNRRKTYRKRNRKNKKSRRKTYRRRQ